MVTKLHYLQDNLGYRHYTIVILKYAVVIFKFVVVGNNHFNCCLAGLEFKNL
jgi:hypothetical protein